MYLCGGGIHPRSGLLQVGLGLFEGAERAMRSSAVLRPGKVAVGTVPLALQLGAAGAMDLARCARAHLGFCVFAGAFGPVCPDVLWGPLLSACLISCDLWRLGFAVAVMLLCLG